MYLTRTLLRKLLRYDPATGHFTWLVDGQNQYQRRGRRAGGLTPDGRIMIGVDGCRYLASRLAVLYMTGQWPRRLIDHANRNTSDNRWRNLREATSSQNLHNMRMKDNQTGFKGVHLCSRTGRYRARIRINYRQVCLGRFDTPQEAHAAYAAAAKRLFGEFGRAK